MLGCYGALWSEKSVTLVALTVPLLAVSIPLIDVILSITRRYLRNRPIFQADRGHIHHRLLDLGLSPKNAVLTIYGVCAVVAVLSLLASALHNQFSGLIVIVFGGAVWIGIRQLDYTEFASASRMFLGGKFRRIIDVETRMADFQSSLSKAASAEECWDQIRTGSRGFGFHEVRMSLGGRVYEEASSGSSKPRWQLRIPLANAQYVNFSRDFDSDMNPLVLSAFVDAVQRGLEARGPAPAVEVIRMPAVSVGRYYTTAASNGELGRAAR
jgi:UDP-GlcNAc:undecaprenyl-phosphate GlcNAc-1-phosphate transferase